MVQNLMKIDICGSKNTVENNQVLFKSEKNDGHFSGRHAYIYDNISLNSYYNEKCFCQKQGKWKRILCSVTISQESLRLGCNVNKYAWQDKDDKIKLCMCFACWLPKAANTHSQHATFTAFPQQQWLHKHTSIICYTQIACFVYSKTHCFVPLIQRCFWLNFTIEEKWSYKVGSNFYRLYKGMMTTHDKNHLHILEIAPARMHTA
jgi:hypothetical protein